MLIFKICTYFQGLYKLISGKHAYVVLQIALFWNLSIFLFAIFILHSRESELYRYTLDGKSALAWELPFLRFMGHLSST